MLLIYLLCGLHFKPFICCNSHTVIALYYLNISHRGIRSSYYEDMFIAKNEQVDEHLHAVGYQGDNVR